MSRTIAENVMNYLDNQPGQEAKKKDICMALNITSGALTGSLADLSMFERVVVDGGKNTGTDAIVTVAVTKTAKWLSSRRW